MKSSGIGGQAVLEGVMMRNKDRYAVAVRRPDGEISVKNWETKSIREKNILLRLPIIRGVVAFIESLFLGIKTLTYSSSFLEEEEDGGKTGAVSAGGEVSGKREMFENILIVLLSIVLAVGFFMLLPFIVSELFSGKVNSPKMQILIEGTLKILLFLGYVTAISFLSDIKRTYMYHGAEHKTINCVENGLDLTVENVRKQSRYHRRCGTSFLLLVIFVSIIFFLFISIDNLWLRMLYRVLLIPVVAGVSFELIQFAGNTDNRVVIFLSKPGLWLQKLTTKEPDDEMIEVAIASVEAVFDWRAYQTEAKKEIEEKKRKKKNRKKEKKENGIKKQEMEEAAVSEDDLAWSREASLPESPKTEPENNKYLAKSKESGTTTADLPEADEIEAFRKSAKSGDEKTAGPETRKAEVSEKNTKSEAEKAAGPETRKAEVSEKSTKSEAEKAARPEKKEEKIKETSRDRENRSSKLERGKKKKTGKMSVLDRFPRSKKRRELEEREARYRNRAAERMRQIKEQEEREAAHERAYLAARKRTEERLAATQELPKLDNVKTAAPKVDIESDQDDLKSLDRFFDE